MKLICKILLLSVFQSVGLYAQNLPRVQQVGMKAPAAVKVDGNLSEWNNTFKADNSANRILYSIANDDKNIYLVVKMKDYHGSYKALWGAIQFTVFKPESSEVISLAYPHVPNRKEEITDIVFDGYHLKKLKTAESTLKIDSMIIAGNKMISASFKEIEMLDAKGELLQVLSLYNDEGIKVAGRFNADFDYVFELSIPLKLIGNLNNADKLKYSLAIVGVLEARPGKPVNLSFKNPSTIPPDMQFTAYTTSLNGEYGFIK